MSGVQLNEKDIFTKHYSSLCNTLTDINNLLPYFVQEKIINANDIEEINAIVTKRQRVENLLSHISGPLTAGNARGFHTMLTIMKEHGTQTTKDLAVKMSCEMISSNNKMESEDLLNLQFNTFVATIEALLDKSHDKLEQSKQFCSNLTISGNADDELLFNDEHLQKINACTTFNELFTILCKHWSWIDYSILTQIITITGLKEAEDELQLFKTRMAFYAGMKVISKNIPPEAISYDYIALSVVIDKPYRELTLEEFTKLRDFNFKYLDIKHYTALPHIKFTLSSDLTLEWYVLKKAALHMAKMAQQNEKTFTSNSVVFIQVDQSFVLDCRAKERKHVKMTEHIQLPCENVTKQIAQSVEITKAKQVDHNVLVFPIWLYLATVVLCVVIVQSYYTAIDHNLQHHFTELYEKTNNEEIITEKDHKINQSSNNTHQIVYELQQQNALLQKALNRFMKMIDQQRGDGIGNCKEQDDELRQARVHIKELQNNINNKLTQTESKLEFLLSLSESVYISYNSNHDDESLWPLILFMSNELSDQVAPAVILKMSNFAKNKEIWHSNSFFAFQEGYEMRLGVSAAGSNDGEGTHVSVYLHLMKGPHDDKLEQSGHWPLRGAFTIELLNQLSDNNHHSHLIRFHHYFCSECTIRVLKGFMATKGLGTSQFISHKTLLHHNNSGYRINDSLMFRISYEDIEPLYQIAPVTFKVTHFFSKQLKNKQAWYSTPFFAFDGGYQMVLKVYVAGTLDGEGTHVSVCLLLMKGPHDDNLEWPLKGTFTIELLDQLNDSDHHSDELPFGPHTPSNITTIKEGAMYAQVAYGISQFISHDILLHHSSNRYLKDDTAYFRISYQSYQELDRSEPSKFATTFTLLTIVAVIFIFFKSIQVLYGLVKALLHNVLSISTLLPSDPPM